MHIDIVQPNENFGGLSYGEWAAEWNKCLFSEDPDTYDGSNVLFLRGNVDYRPISKSKSSPRHIDLKLYLTKQETRQCLYLKELLSSFLS